MRRPESLTAVVMPLLALATACTSPSTHVLVGNAFDPGARCLQPSAGFDVVDGPEPSADCSPTCVIDARTATAYVTVVCPPYPPLDTTELADASTGSADPCPAALAAWASAAVCGQGGDSGVDGGSTDAGTDATPDAANGATGG